MSIGIAYNPCKNCKETDKCSICELTYYRKGYINSPTADVVEVVRCEDCKHNPQNGGECDRSITHTSRGHTWEVNTYRYIGIDYCSYGERREDAKPIKTL